MARNMNEMRQARAKLVADGRVILEAAEKEKRGLNAEEQASYNKIMNDVVTRGTEIEVEGRQQELEYEISSGAGPQHRGEELPGNAENGEVGPRATPEYRAMFEKVVRRGMTVLTEREVRSMQADDAVGGGYLVAPEQFVATLIEKLKDLVFIRGLATTYRLTSAATMGFPSLDTDLDDGAWTSEIGEAPEDTNLRFGKREFKPYPLAKLVKVSRKLMQVAALNPVTLLQDRMAYKFSVTQEKAFLAGTGVGQPLGLFTASDLGIPVSQDISIGNTATGITPAGLFAAKFALKGQYWKNAKWIFHRNAIAQLAELKDGIGRYMWQPALAGLANQSYDILLNLPVMMSEYVPNTFTANKYVGMVGDFSYYWIVDALDMNIQVLWELYARTNQVGFIGRMETDGMPVLAEAFARIKLGA